MRRRLTGVGFFAVLILTACSSKSVTSTTPTPTSTAASPSPSTSLALTTPTPATTTTPGASPSAHASGGTGTITVADANNGQTVTLRAGSHLRVVLSSTYWEVQASSNPSALRSEGSPVTSPSPGCIPGAGCGTVAATFTALAPGNATVVATRTSCGEAMLCQGAAGHYQIEVVVAA
jgi:hypothetical protein